MIKAFLKRVGLLPKGVSSKGAVKGKLKPIIIPRSQHGVSRKGISENALKVLYRLNRHGHEAYLVGGGVRDLLLGLHPKDFDVVTDATPDEVRRIFRNCRLIGRRFRLAHIYFGHDIIEVATFRAKVDIPSEDHSHSEHGMILRDNVYGTLGDDVWRRDFTINALYYNIADFSIVDFTGGFADLKAKKMRMIGDAKERYREDPVRMLRAIRFASKVNFPLPSELSRPISELKSLISHVSSARLFEEMMKLFHSGAAFPTFEHLKEFHLFEELFPQTHFCIEEGKYPTDALLRVVFQSTDQRIAEEKPVTPSFIIAALLWHPIVEASKRLVEEGIHYFPARMQAIEDVLKIQVQRVSFPKRLVQGAREIWLLQMRLEKRHGKRAETLMYEPRFRAAYDFLELRAKAGEPVKELAQWWQSYIQSDAPARHALVKALTPGASAKKKKKKHRRKPKAKPAPESDVL
jgi:poly(A) polymerase